MTEDARSKLEDCLVGDDRVQALIPCLEWHRRNLLKRMGHADEQRPRRGGGDRTIVEPAALTKPSASVVERDEGDDDGIVIAKRYGFANKRLVDAERSGCARGVCCPAHHGEGSTFHPRDRDDRSTCGNARQKLVDIDLAAYGSITSDRRGVTNHRDLRQPADNGHGCRGNLVRRQVSPSPPQEAPHVRPLGVALRQIRDRHRRKPREGDPDRSPARQ